LKSNLSRVIYANAITLTPGTVSVKVDTSKESIMVHSLSIESAEDLCSGRMANAVPENADLYPEDKAIVDRGAGKKEPGDEEPGDKEPGYKEIHG